MFCAAETFTRITLSCGQLLKGCGSWRQCVCAGVDLSAGSGLQVTRGLKLREGEPPAALNGFLYSIMRTSKQQRRAIAISCLRNFDEHAVSQVRRMPRSDQSDEKGGITPFRSLPSLPKALVIAS